MNGLFLQSLNHSFSKSLSLTTDLRQVSSLGSVNNQINCNYSLRSVKTQIKSINQIRYYSTNNRPVTSQYKYGIIQLQPVINQSIIALKESIPFSQCRFHATQSSSENAPKRRIDKILIANRGEIACRVIRLQGDWGLKL